MYDDAGHNILTRGCAIPTTGIKNITWNSCIACQRNQTESLFHCSQFIFRLNLIFQNPYRIITVTKKWIFTKSDLIIKE